MVRAFTISVSILFLAGGSAVATPSGDPAQIEEHQVLRAAMDSAMAELMAPGPRQDGWDKGGVDIYQLLEASPGGTKQNYLLSIDKEGERDITVVDSGEPGIYLPKSWKKILGEGETGVPAGPNSLTIAPVDGPFFLAGWDKRRRSGDAFCSDGGLGAELYEAPEPLAPSELPRRIIPTIFASMVQHLKDKVVCWRYDRHGDAFRVTYFLENGSTLPAMNSFEERVMIVPAASIEELIKEAKPSN